MWFGNLAAPALSVGSCSENHLGGCFNDDYGSRENKLLVRFSQLTFRIPLQGVWIISKLLRTGWTESDDNMAKVKRVAE